MKSYLLRQLTVSFAVMGLMVPFAYFGRYDSEGLDPSILLYFYFVWAGWASFMVGWATSDWIRKRDNDE